MPEDRGFVRMSIIVHVGSIHVRTSALAIQSAFMQMLIDIVVDFASVSRVLPECSYNSMDLGDALIFYDDAWMSSRSAASRRLNAGNALRRTSST